MYSVLILTKNESLNIDRCLKSVSSDDVWVLDSHSDDDTVNICTQHGANVVYRKFDNYANQRNFGLSLDFKYRWIFMLDADEALPTLFDCKIKDLIECQSSDVGIISLLRRDYFLGTWLRGASGYPVYFPRIFRKGVISVERSVNEVYQTPLKNVKSKIWLNHYPFEKGIYEWVSKHNRYSSMEASTPDAVIHSFDTYTANRMRLKRFFYKLPMRPLVIFIYFYVFKAGFLAGKPGIYFCSLRAFYELLIIIKKLEVEK